MYTQTDTYVQYFIYINSATHTVYTQILTLLKTEMICLICSQSSSEPVTESTLGSTSARNTSRDSRTLQICKGTTHSEQEWILGQLAWNHYTVIK